MEIVRAEKRDFIAERNLAMIIKKISVENINPAPYNPRKNLKPDDREYTQLVKSMNEFGCIQPVEKTLKFVMKQRYIQSYSVNSFSLSLTFTIMRCRKC